MKLFGD